MIALNKNPMKKLLYIFTFLFVFLHSYLFAQIGKVGVNTSTPAAMFHVKDSSVLFTGVSPLPGSPGAPPASGPGTRMMWYPDKAAFRVGTVNGTHWNKDSIGLYSFASGFKIKLRALIPLLSVSIMK